MAAVLRGGPGAVLSHESAAALWRIEDRQGLITISLPSPRTCSDPSLVAHSVGLEPSDLSRRWGIPVTSPARTLIDLAASLGTGRPLPGRGAARLEAAVSAADRLGLIDTERLRDEVESRPGLRGVPSLRGLLDRRTFHLTDSELERRFLPLARRAGLAAPETQVEVGGYRVDFLWREFGLVVETDGLTYHRTASQQERDARRDQAHAAVGLQTLRFSHSQVTHDPGSVVTALAKVAGILSQTARARLRA